VAHKLRAPAEALLRVATRRLPRQCTSARQLHARVRRRPLSRVTRHTHCPPTDTGPTVRGAAAGAAELQRAARRTLRPICRALSAATFRTTTGAFGRVKRDAFQPARRPRPFPPKAPNGQRVSGERRGEADERVRCTRVLGDPTLRLLLAIKLKLANRAAYRDQLIESILPKLLQ
jgi:hypothetical protein